MSVALQPPEGEGTVAPTGADLLGPAHIAWPFAAVGSNIARLREGWRLAASIALGSGLLVHPAEVTADLTLGDDGVDPIVRETHGAFYHGVGTCRMGDPGTDRVTDPDSSVIAIEGLFLVDASVIPTVPRTNTNLAAMAIAEHMATNSSQHNR